MKRLLTILDSLQEQVEVKEKPQDRVSDAPPQREDSVHAHIIPNLVKSSEEKPDDQPIAHKSEQPPDFLEPEKEARSSQVSVTQRKSERLASSQSAAKQEPKVKVIAGYVKKIAPRRGRANADGSDDDDSEQSKDKPKDKKLGGKRAKRGKTLLHSINNVEETESENEADDESDMVDTSKKKQMGNIIRNMGTSSLATGDATGKLFYV